MLDKIARWFALFINWFNGICAVVCGCIMMLAGLSMLPAEMDGFMPLSIYDNFPLHDVFFTSHFWPGLALLLVNGVANIVALVFRFRSDRIASYRWGVTAGILLIVWTGVEMVFVPNEISVIYLVIGVLQLAATWWALRTWGIRA
ncbi:hypothetical protein [Gordonibacter sp.]|uniref:hypothetical protein n=1 Tax=Gordonibacter sp. TaxID=1968902 RepID=UPI002FC701C3